MSKILIVSVLLLGTFCSGHVRSEETVEQTCEDNREIKPANLAKCFSKILELHKIDKAALEDAVLDARETLKPYDGLGGKYLIEKTLAFQFGGIHLPLLGITYDWKNTNRLIFQQGIREKYEEHIDPLRSAISGADQKLSLSETLNMAIETYPKEDPVYAFNALALLTMVQVLEADREKRDRGTAPVIKNLETIPGTETNHGGGIYHFWGLFFRNILYRDVFSRIKSDLGSMATKYDEPDDRLADKLGIDTAHELWKNLD